MSGGSGNSTFYSQDMGFEDNFNPSLADDQQASSSKSSASYSEKKGLSASPSAVKRSSRPSTPDIPQATPSPLTCYAIRLKHGEDLRRSLLNFCKKNELQAAFVLTCVGSALTAKLRPASAVPNSEGNYVSFFII